MHARWKRPILRLGGTSSDGSKMGSDDDDDDAGVGEMRQRCSIKDVDVGVAASSPCLFYEPRSAQSLAEHRTSIVY